MTDLSRIPTPLRARVGRSAHKDRATTSGIRSTVLATAPMDTNEARRRTDRFKVAMVEQADELTELRDRGAWAALSYAGFADYCRDEFSLSEDQVSRLLQRERAYAAITTAIAEVTGGDTARARTAIPHVSQRAAAKITRNLPAAAKAAKRAAKRGEDPVKAAVAAVSKPKPGDASKAVQRAAQAARDAEKAATDSARLTDLERSFPEQILDLRRQLAEVTAERDECLNGKKPPPAPAKKPTATAPLSPAERPPPPGAKTNEEFKAMIRAAREAGKAKR